MFFTAHEEKPIAPKFSTENMLSKNSLMTVQHEKRASRRKFSVKRVQQKKQHKIVQHKRRTTRKKRNMKRIQYLECSQEKSTRQKVKRECNSNRNTKKSRKVKEIAVH